MKEKEFYNAAMYLRLSREDGECGAESGSIGSQRDLIRSFIRKQDNMRLFDTYADDGWSGVNFDRPEFKRMMADIEAGKVDCVIVKDLSRLGRDYIEAGRLIQKTFPAFSVRFIALTDQFDSLTADADETSFVVPVKNFINDSYSRDISGKVRSHLKVKREKGDFTGAFTVYGYKKSPENHSLLVPDEFAANIVRKIFAWKIDGYSNLAIARKLDDMGILSPMEYKKLQGQKFRTGFAAGVKAAWSSVAVKRILTNEIYTGTLVQGKMQKVNYKVKKSVKKPAEEWVRTENTHKAIIAQEDFALAGELLRNDTRAGGGEKKAHSYAGLLFCGDCGEPMTRRVNRYKGNRRVSFICAASNRGEGCARHTISEEALNMLVLTGIRRQISLFVDQNRVRSQMEALEIDFKEAAAFENEISRMHKEQEKYLSLREGLYEDLKKGMITEDDFKNFSRIYERRGREIQKTGQRQEETVKRLFRSGVTAGINLERMKTVMQITQLDRTALVTFIKRVCVYEDKRVYLEFRHKNMFSCFTRQEDGRAERGAL